MSMTREEAIKLLKQYQGYEPMFPDGETLKHAFDLTDETVDTLLTALRLVSREQVEKSEWIWRTEDVYICSSCGGKTRVDECMGSPIYNFCPFCMAPMTDEAVEMVMERMEEVLNADTGSV